MGKMQWSHKENALEGGSALISVTGMFLKSECELSFESELGSPLKIYWHVIDIEYCVC